MQNNGKIIQAAKLPDRPICQIPDRTLQTLTTRPHQSFHTAGHQGCTCFNDPRYQGVPLRCTCSGGPLGHKNFALTDFYLHAHSVHVDNAHVDTAHGAHASTHLAQHTHPAHLAVRTCLNSN
jgi:hypothetical protein